MESQFDFLRVKNGRTYFARVAVASAAGSQDVRLSPEAGKQNPRAPEAWLQAARLGAERALRAHTDLGGQTIGLVVSSVSGTEVDTSANTVEVAAFCAAWKALGRGESKICFEFDGDWSVNFVA
jgi:hypothetical protein